MPVTKTVRETEFIIQQTPSTFIDFGFEKPIIENFEQFVDVEGQLDLDKVKSFIIIK